jgi:hypothetical protein
LVLFRQAGRLAILRYALLFLGVLRASTTTILRARGHVTGDRALPVQGDGEIVGHLPVTIRICTIPWLDLSRS